jgi:hypothetical protein
MFIIQWSQYVKPTIMQLLRVRYLRLWIYRDHGLLGSGRLWTPRMLFQAALLTGVFSSMGRQDAQDLPLLSCFCPRRMMDADYHALNIVFWRTAPLT